MCLVEKQYDQAQDIWSIGCIVHELLQYINKEEATFYDDFQTLRYAFQGGSCFPMSPFKKRDKSKESDKNKGVPVIANSDQVKVILRGLGPQVEEEDFSFVTS